MKNEMGAGWLIESETTCQLTSINWIFEQKVFLKLQERSRKLYWITNRLRQALNEIKRKITRK